MLKKSVKVGVARDSKCINEIYGMDLGEPHGFCEYHIVNKEFDQEHGGQQVLCDIKFQSGERNSPKSIDGVTDSDLLEVVRHHLEKYNLEYFYKHGNTDFKKSHAALLVEEALILLNDKDAE